MSDRPPSNVAPLPGGDLPEHPVTVLLVDDQRMVGEAVRRMLATQEDIRFHYCQDPTQAVAMAVEVEPTVILVDLLMVPLDGLELVKQLREKRATKLVPIIVLSTREEAATKAQAFELGANDYLVKLPDPVEVIARIRHHSTGYILRLERDEAFEALDRSQRALADELDQAAKYVQTLLPAPSTDRLCVDWRFIPSASLGGDAFGYHWLDEDHFALYLLDVSGHGVGSALLSVSVLNTLRARTLPKTEFRDPGSVVSALNRAFRTQDHDGKFFTIWYGVWVSSTRKLRWAGAGHPAALFFEDPATDADAALLESGGPMPGVLPDLTYVTQERPVEPGARLIIYSDGVYEVRGPDGVVRSHEEFLEALREPANRTVERITANARAIRGGGDFDDDVSLVQVDFE